MLDQGVIVSARDSPFLGHCIELGHPSACESKGRDPFSVIDILGGESVTDYSREHRSKLNRLLVSE
jgi:hypothetical protein